MSRVSKDKVALRSSHVNKFISDNQINKFINNGD